MHLQTASSAFAFLLAVSKPRRRDKLHRDIAQGANSLGTRGHCGITAARIVRMLGSAGRKVDKVETVKAHIAAQAH